MKGIEQPPNFGSSSFSGAALDAGAVNAVIKRIIKTTENILDNQLIGDTLYENDMNFLVVQMTKEN